MKTQQAHEAANEMYRTEGTPEHADAARNAEKAAAAAMAELETRTAAALISIAKRVHAAAQTVEKYNNKALEDPHNHDFTPEQRAQLVMESIETLEGVADQLETYLAESGAEDDEGWTPEDDDAEHPGDIKEEAGEMLAIAVAAKLDRED